MVEKGGVVKVKPDIGDIIVCETDSTRIRRIERTRISTDGKFTGLGTEGTEVEERVRMPLKVIIFYSDYLRGYL